MREIGRRATVISLTAKKNLVGQEFKDYDELKKMVKVCFWTQSMDFCQYWLGKLVPTYDKFLSCGGIMCKNGDACFFVIKPTRCTNFTNLFCHENLHVSDSSSVHHQEFIHCTLSNCICHTGTVHTAFEQEHMFLLESCLQTCMTHTIAQCTVNILLMM